MLFSRIRSITPDEAFEQHRAGELELVDVREPAELLQAHIAGARNVPLGQLADRLGELGTGRPVAFVCQTGMRSARATKAAAKAGLKTVNVKGGVAAWSRAGLPLTR